MQELLRKPLLKIGDRYSAPQGDLLATPKRARHWVEKFNQLKAENFSFPVPWGHKLTALPRQESCTKAQWQAAIERRLQEESRWNASYIEQLDIEHTPEGDFVMLSMRPPPGYKVCPTTNALINERDGTTIKEISGAWGNFRDGKNRVHKDILIHAALCTRPVWANQAGFEMASDGPTMLSATTVEYSFCLSSSGALAMDKKKKPGDDMMDEDEQYVPDDELDDLPEEDAPLDDLGDLPGDKPLDKPLDDLPKDDLPLDAPPLDVPPVDVVAPVVPPVEPAKPMGPDRAKEALRLFGEMGLALPPDTNESNLIERLIIALTVAQNMGARFQKDDSNPDELPPPPASATSGQDAPPTPEPPPMMMSTITHMLSQIPDAGVREKTRKTYEREQARMRKDVRAIAAEIKELGCPAHLADDLAEGGATIMLSFTPGGDIRLPRKLGELRAIRRVLREMRHGPRKPPAAKIMKTLSTKTTITEPPENPLMAGARQRLAVNRPEGAVYNAMLAGAASETGATLNGNGKH